MRAVTLLLFTCAPLLVGQILPLSSVPLDNSITPHILVIHYGAPEYSKALASLVPGSTATITPILPFSIILKNISNDPLLMTSVLFEVQDARGHIKRHSLNTLDLMPSSLAHLLPHSYRFVSVSAPANRAVASGHPENLQTPTVSLQTVASDLNQAQRVVVSVDGLILLSGIFLGPGKSGVFRRVQDEQRADAWLSERLTTLRDATPNQLSQELAALTAIAPGPTSSPFERDFYNLKINQRARELMDVLGRAGAPAVLNSAAQWRKQIVVVKQP